MSTDAALATAHEQHRAVAAFEEAAQPAVTLFCAADDGFRHQYGGMTYTFDPNSEVRIANRHIDNYLGGYDLPAHAIAKQLMERLWDRGLLALMGDGMDEARIAAGRQRWLQWKVAICREGEREWLAKCERATRDPGALPPRQPAKVREQIKFLELYERGTLDRKQYVSRIDSYESDDIEDVLQHNRTKYGKGDESEIIDTQSAFSEPAPTVSPEPTPAGFTSKNSVEDESEPVVDPALLYAAAKDAGVPLLKRDLEALFEGDQETIDRVASEIVQKQAADQGAEATG